MPICALGDLAPDLPPEGRFWIAPSAHVIGAVRIGEDVGVWFGTTVRGDNEPITIGPRTNLQENCVLHSDPGFPLRIGAECTIGHGAIVHGCTLGDRVLLGMGATVLNGAEIGDESLVGASALVTEGKAFPPRSLIVGAPARAVRTLSDAEVAGLAASAAHYVANWQRFAAGFRVL